MEIKTIVTEQMGQNCYLLTKNGKGILIDPGMDTFKILRETQNIEVTHILLTHCHYDHLWSLNELRKGKIAVCSKKCAENMLSLKKTLCPLETLPKASAEKIITDGENININGIEIKGIYTPGHTDGSMCFLADGNLFSGDTIFYENIGRWDLPTGNYEELKASVTKLYMLADDTAVYPGHGPATSVGHEKKYGYFTV